MKNTLMKIEKTAEFIKEIKKLGYQESRSEGHMIFSCPNRAVLAIPRSRVLSPGTRRNLVKLILGGEYNSK